MHTSSVANTDDSLCPAVCLRCVAWVCEFKNLRLLDGKYKCEVLLRQKALKPKGVDQEHGRSFLSSSMLARTICECKVCARCCIFHAKDLFADWCEGSMGAAEPCSGQGDFQEIVSTKCSMGQGATYFGSALFNLVLVLGNAAQHIRVRMPYRFESAMCVCRRLQP